MYVIYMCVFVFLINLYYYFLHYYFYILYDWNDVVLLRLILFFCFEFVVYMLVCACVKICCAGNPGNHANNPSSSILF